MSPDAGKWAAFNSFFHLEKAPKEAILPIMSQVEALEQNIRRLPKDQVWQIYNWLAEYLEDQESLSPEFVKRIEEGKRDLEAGRVRTMPGKKS